MIPREEFYKQKFNEIAGQIAYLMKRIEHIETVVDRIFEECQKGIKHCQMMRHKREHDEMERKR